MSGRRSVQKVLVPPINLIFRFLQSIWVYDQPSVRIEGVISGFDEFMNVILDASEIKQKGKENESLGTILLKGDNITLIQTAPSSAAMAH